MKKLLTLLLLAFAFVVASPRVALAESSAVERMAERAVVFVETIAGIVDRDMRDCDKMGTDLGKLADDTASERAELKSYKDKLTPAQKKAFLAKYGARLQAAAAKIVGGVQACGDNAKVKAAMAKLADTAG